jgi:hypothetical protein
MAASPSEGLIKVCKPGCGMAFSSTCSRCPSCGKPWPDAPKEAVKPDREDEWQEEEERRHNRQASLYDSQREAGAAR